MGLCFSRKQQEKPPGPPPSVSETSTRSKKPSKIAVVVADEKAKKTPKPKRAAAKEEEPAAADKKDVFVVKTKSAASGEEKEEARPVVVTTVPVRTSSCTKEEVDAILIQCGRLSRSSSGRASSSETGGGCHRRHSGSKRSYDFDQERRAGGGGADEEGDWERQGVPVSRPSPHRCSPQRKRSGSRERSGSGSRRASRSPGRRAGGALLAATASSGGGGERARQQPGKMVSVPAREKRRAPSPAASSEKRCASPRSSSPARLAAGNENAGGGQTSGPTPSLSRSSSRKAEQSPYRRSPMAEIDENSLRNSNNNKNAKPQKKSTENAVATATQKSTERAKEQTTACCRSGKEKLEIAEETTVAASETRAPSSKTTATRIVAERLNPRSGCRSRRASRDFDQSPNSYATQLLEDIQNYHHHQQQNTSAVATAATLPSFSLPACVSKACSILEAVADLNSTSSENRACEARRSANDKGLVNEPLSRDDLAEPSVHKYVSVRGETEPQESVGSTSVSSHPWTPSWEPNSVESTDRTWSDSRSNNGDAVVEQGSHGARSPLNNRPRQSKQRPAQPDPSGRTRGAGSGGNNVHRGRSAHRGGVASGRSGVRAVSASS